MKKFILLALISIFASSVFSQTVDTRRKIEVNGTSEMEVTPDIIRIAISLKEYLKDNNSKKKVEINDLETKLYNAVQAAGIPKENLTINNISGYNNTWEKKKNPDFLVAKQYSIKVTDLNKYNQLMEALDPKSIQYTNIESYDYSGIEALKKELKVKALKLAKEKASYLAEALNNKVGEPLEIQEINNESYPQPMYRTNMMEFKTADSSSSPEIDFKKIKLNYQMRVVFEIIK
ncbi:SIMPL domain-containing protein [Arcticibacter eurypsychrophilus]|uniref:SIMPL domain-containing protein n=1 Tax=Arcticibacter eurypsychrophilus TaxID=1434752 RepID=UPI00084D3CBF|nr:SIMPL domain-containing protein [Arcticibacter eurypsychrophilus]